jgi:integrase
VPYQEYRSDRAHYFMIFYYESGRRCRESRSTREAAKARAREIAVNILNGQTAMSRFTESDRASYRRALQILAPTGKQLELAVSEYTAALEQLRTQDSGLRTQDVSLQDAIKFFLENRPRGFAPRPLPDLVAAFLAEKDGEISRDYHTHLANQLGRLAAHYDGPLHSLKSADINAWLRGLKGSSGSPLGPRARHNHRAALDQLAHWAQGHAYLPKTWSEMEDVPDPGHKTGDIKILTPEQVTRLITARQHAEECGRAQKSLVPFLALQAFAGIRHEEIVKLDWRDIDLEKRWIYISKSIAKTGAGRGVPICDNLAAWLSSGDPPYARRNGPICSLSQISGALTKAKRAAGIPAGENETRNVLRKSYISYRLAATKSIAQVAEEAGNSPGIIRKHYNRPIPETEAKRWFSIWPTAASVLQLNFRL